MLDTFCGAIRDFEGKPGDRSYLNNSPGDMRCSPIGYLPKYGNVICNDGFAKFPTWDLGWEYLQNLVFHRAELHPDWTILDFFADPKLGYAPVSDNNPSAKYAAFVAARCGVPVTTTLRVLFTS